MSWLAVIPNIGYLGWLFFCKKSASFVFDHLSDQLLLVTATEPINIQINSPPKVF